MGLPTDPATPRTGKGGECRRASIVCWEEFTMRVLAEGMGVPGENDGPTPRPAGSQNIASGEGIETFVQAGSVSGGMHIHATPGTPVAAVPRELPLDVLGFSGREVQLAELDRFQALAGEQASAVVISAIDGMAGVGKTALAVHAGHRLADRYPDGQLFVDLHGYTPDVPPVESATGLEQMLRSLGVQGERVPETVEERAALLRTRLAGKRVLVVLDNAATDTQVRPLLPGTPGCLVLVTSRTRLTGLDDAIPLSLDVLPAGDAVALFVRTVGEHRRTDADAGVVAEIVQLCGRLPLAIRIAAARLRHRPTWTPHHLAELLRDERSRLGELHAGQLSVTTALGVSYTQLTTEQRRVFRLLSLHPGSDIEPYVTAALAGITAPAARRLLEELLDVHLLIQSVPGRYTFHDLVRAYATERTRAGDSEADRRAALTRLLDHYAYAAAIAMDAVHAYETDQRPRPPEPRTPVPDLGDPAAAEAWLDAELPNLLATARTAGRAPDYVVHLSATLHRHLSTRARYTDAQNLHQLAHGLARTTGNRTGELNALNGLGEVHLVQDRYEQAGDHYGRALEIAHDIGDRVGAVVALNGLSVAVAMRGRYEQALDHLGQALEIAHDTGDRTGEVDALNGFGQARFTQARYEQAADHHGRALEIARSIRYRHGERVALFGLGCADAMRGRHEQAIDYLGRALEIAYTTGHRHGESDVLAGFGFFHLVRGQHERAADYFGQMLEIARTIGNPTGEAVALNGLGRVLLMQNHHEQAGDHFAQELRIARETGDRKNQLEAHLGLGRVHCATGDHDQAFTRHQLALEMATELGEPPAQACAHDGLAHTHHATGHREQARRHWQAALDILTAQDIDYTLDPQVTTAALRAHLDT
ncbi:MAG: ATP-binding protein [Actinomadura sp.]